MSGSEKNPDIITISALPNDDVCTILPRISGGDVAGTSLIETVVVVGKLCFRLHFNQN